MEDYNVKLVLILTIGFGLSSVLGYLTHRMKLSPILGYLIAGYIIGPFSPGIVVDIKPLVTFAIVKLWNYPTHVAVGVGLAVAQIGEFSFILAEEALKLHMLPEEGFDIIVACALVSIALNPPLFRLYAESLKPVK